MAEWIILFGDDDESYGAYQVGSFDSKQAAEDAAKELENFAREEYEKEGFSYLAQALWESELQISELMTVAEIIAEAERDEDPAEGEKELGADSPRLEYLSESEADQLGG